MLTGIIRYIEKRKIEIKAVNPRQLYDHGKTDNHLFLLCKFK